MNQVFRPRPMFAALVLGMAALGSGQAGATTNEQAEQLCATELATRHDALNIRELRVRRRDGRASVFGTADFSDGVTAEFRCRIYRERVRYVAFRVEDASEAKGWDWSVTRPRGTAQVQPTEDVANTDPEAETETEAETPRVRVQPRFQTVRSDQTGFRKPEAEAEAEPAETEAPVNAETEATQEPAQPQETRVRPRFVAVPQGPSTTTAAGAGADTETETDIEAESGDTARPRFRKAP